MKKIFITFPISEPQLNQLNRIFPVDCVSGHKDSYQETLERIGQYEAMLVGGIKKIDKGILDQASSLKIISKYGVGYDDIDVDYAREKGIIVSNTPNSVTAPTADLAMGLLLALCRRIPATDRAIRTGDFKKWFFPALPSIMPQNKTLGIVGMGRIGKAVAKRALPFGIKIAYYQRNKLSPDLEKKYGATYMKLPDLLKKSDFVSVHTPLNATTHHLIGREQLALMKDSALLINTARGNVIDEQALIEALQTKQIAGAALDVFAEEPHIPKAFLSMDHVILAPHMGTGSKEARQNMFNEAMNNIHQYFKGEEVSNRVN